MPKKLNWLYFALALFTIIVWGSTFAATKILLSFIPPITLLIYRFFFSYLVLLCFAPKRIKSTWREELLFLAAGLTGGTLYYLGENFALSFSTASNVGLLTATAPLFTAIVIRYASPNEKITRGIILGSTLALFGVACIVLNGNFSFQIRPLGDLLALLAAFSWALYALAIKKIATRFPSVYITKKVFLYAFLTSLPLSLTPNFDWSFAAFTNPSVLIYLLYLSVFASALGYFVWNIVMHHLGPVRANNFIYFVPLISLFFAFLLLGEQLTIYMALGAICIILGVFITERSH
ncbi:MAG: DMT family transporter [Clostridia bacterium]